MSLFQKMGIECFFLPPIFQRREKCIDMNKHRKGNYYELKVKKCLEKRGWIVYKPVRTRFSQKDIFGCADLLAYHPDLGFLNFVQVKSNKGDVRLGIRKMESAIGDVKDVFQEVWLKDEIVWARNLVGNKV